MEAPEDAAANQAYELLPRFLSSQPLGGMDWGPRTPKYIERLRQESSIPTNFERNVKRTSVDP